MTTKETIDSLPLEQKITLRTFNKLKKNNARFAGLTCYDATTARWLEASGIPLLLVGDTAAEVMLGFPSTIHAPFKYMVEITAAVRRGAPNAFVMADMPFNSWQGNFKDALNKSSDFLTKGFADSIKFEVGKRDLKKITRLIHAGIPVIAHLGSRPQQIHIDGGYKAAGKTLKEANELLENALRFEDAGCIMILLEAIPAEVAQEITEQLSIPVIGVGAGPYCDGQILVLHDLLGLSPHAPSFAPVTASAGDQLRKAAIEWKKIVISGKLGEHPYHLSEKDLYAFLNAKKPIDF